MKKIIRKSIALPLLCIFMITSLFVGPSNVVLADSMLINGGFESGLWPLKTGGSIDTTVKHSGSQSAKIVGSTAEQYIGTDLIPVNSNSIYELSAWIKTSGISRTDGVSVNALMVDANNRSLGFGSTFKAIKTGGTQDWTRYTVDIGNFEAVGTTYLKIYVRVDANITGTAWFDDVELQKKLTDNMIANPGFEAGWPIIRGGGFDTDIKYSGSRSAKFVAGTAEQFFGTGLIPVNPNGTYELSAWIKTSDISRTDGVSVNALMVDANNRSLGFGSTFKAIKTGGTKDWTRYTVDVGNFVPGTVYLKIYVRVDGNTTGTAWFDDAELKLKKFIFRVNGPVGNIFTSDEPIKMNLSFTNQDILDQSVHVNYRVSDYNNSTVTTGDIDVQIKPGENILKELNFSTICGYGTYTLETNVTGDNGNISISKVYPFSKALTSKENVQDGIFGTCTHTLGTTSSDTLEKYLTLAAQAGIKWIRDDAHWSSAEKVKGQINIPASWDLYADTALAKGIKPLFIIDYGNPLYDDGKAPYTDEGIAAYANYAGKIAEHFKGKVDHFEIWNEYNLTGPNPDRRPPETYEKMLKAAYTAIKAANPDAFVVGCATGLTDLEFIKRVLAAGGYNYMDAVSIHPYSYPYSIGPEDGGFINNLKSVRDLFKDYGPAKPVWVSEIGWATYDMDKGGTTELLSGAYAVRTYTHALGSGLADKVFIYDFQNDGVSTGYNEDNFGLIRASQGETVPLSAKMNYAAYSAFTSMISGADFVKAYTTDDNTQVYRFHRNSDNKDVLVIWRNSESSSLLLKLGTPGVSVYDLSGNRSDMSAVDGTILLTASEIPVYIEGSFSQDIEIINPFSVTAIPILKNTSEGNQWSIDININNNMSTTLTGKVKILEPSLMVENIETPFTIDSKNSTVIPFAFPGVPEEKLYNLKAQISFDNGTSTVIDRKISFLAANQAYKAPVIDGTISQDEWAKAIPLLIDNASQVKNINNWGGVNDLSGKGYVKWDKDNFYLALEVKDNVHFQNGTGGDIWQGDSIQFAIDPGRNSKLAGLGYNEIGVALNRNTSSVIKWRWTAPAGKATGAMNSMNCQVKRDDSSGTTTYEMAIPWSDLLPDGITAAPGSDLGFSMLINDNDGSGRRGWMEYMSGIGASKDPSAFGDLALVNLPDLESVTLSADKTILKSGETASISVKGIMEDGSQADLSKAQIVYTSDNEQAAKIDGSGIVTPIGEGTVNIKAAVTLFGVTKENSVQIIVDNTPPVTTAQIGGALKNGWYNSDVTVTMSAYDKLSGVAQTEYRIGTDGDWSIYAGPVALTQEGTYTIQYRSTDKAGNVENIKQQTVQIDKTPPAFNLIVNGNALKEGDSFDDYLPLTFKVWDNLSGVASAQISVGGSVYAVDLQTQSGVVIDLAGKVGIYTVTVIAEDNAGNILEKNFTFTVTTSIDSMKNLIDRYVKAGDLGGPLADQLTNNLNQAQHQLDIRRPDQAAKHMEDFVKHLNSEALNSNVKATVQKILNADAEALIKLWLGKKQ